MGTLTSIQAGSNSPAISASQAGEVISVRGVINLSAALALNDILEMVKLPANHVIVDCVLDTDDLDTNGAPLISLTAGLTAGTVAELIGANTVGQAGGVARMDAVAGVRVAASSSDRVVGVKITTGPATGATTGQIGLTVSYKAA